MADKLKVLGTLVLVSSFSAQIISSPISALAETSKPNKEVLQKEVIQEKKASQYGLSGYYYEDSAFQNMTTFNKVEGAHLYLKNDHVQDEDGQHMIAKPFSSIRWKGYVKAKETGTYKFELQNQDDTARFKNFKILVDGEEVKDAKILDANTVHSIEIQAVTNQSDDTFSNVYVDAKIQWQLDGQFDFETIPSENLLRQNIDEKNNKNQTVQRSKRSAGFVDIEKGLCTNKEQEDCDGDGIPNSIEENPYTLIKKKDGTFGLFKWDKRIHKNRTKYSRYTSSKYAYSTTNDRFSDYEKIIGSGEADAIPKDSKSPIIAAYPTLKPRIKEIILTDDITISDSENSVTGKSTSNTYENSHTTETTHGFNIGGKIEGGAAGPSGGLDFGYNFSHRTSDTAGFQYTNANHKDVELGSSKQWNKAHAGLLQVNIDFTNIGLAKIFNIQPTLDIKIGNETIRTVKLDGQFKINSIYPGKTYPEKDSIAIATSDDFKASSIYLNADQLAKVKSGAPISVEITQYDGTVRESTDCGKDEKCNWDNIINDINLRTAEITVSTPTGGTRTKKVAAPLKDNNILHMPELTLRDVLVDAFGVREESNTLKIDDYLFDKLRENWLIQYDWKEPSTTSDISGEIREAVGEKENWLDLQLKAGMNIIIKKLKEDEQPSILDATYTENGDSLQVRTYSNYFGYPIKNVKAEVEDDKGNKKIIELVQNKKEPTLYTNKEALDASYRYKDTRVIVTNEKDKTNKSIIKALPYRGEVLKVDTQGMHVKDTSQFSHELKSENMPTTFNGVLGNSLRFHNGEHLTAPNFKELNIGKDDDYTVSFWVRGTMGDSNASYNIISNRNKDLNQEGWDFVLKQDYSTMPLVWRYKTSTETKEISIPKVADYRWHHIAMVYKQQERKVYLYKDGQMVNPNGEPVSNNLNNDSMILIGDKEKYNNGSEIHLYKPEISNKVMKDDDIKSIYNKFPQAPEGEGYVLDASGKPLEYEKSYILQNKDYPGKGVAYDPEPSKNTGLLMVDTGSLLFGYSLKLEKIGDSSDNKVKYGAEFRVALGDNLYFGGGGIFQGNDLNINGVLVYPYIIKKGNSGFLKLQQSGKDDGYLDTRGSHGKAWLHLNRSDAPYANQDWQFYEKITSDEESAILSSGETYQIVSALNNSSVIDWNKSDNNSTLWQNNGGNNQKWKFEYDENKKAYQIKSLENDNMVLEWDTEPRSHHNLRVTPNQQKEEQYWIVEPTGDGYAYFKNMKKTSWFFGDNSSPVIDVRDTNNGANLSLGFDMDEKTAKFNNFNLKRHKFKIIKSN